MANVYYSPFYPAITGGVEGTTVPTPPPSQEAPNAVTIYADYSGEVLSGQLPMTINIIRKSGSTDVSTQSTWTLEAYNATATIDTSGFVTITAVAQSGQLVVTSIYKDSILRTTIPINVVNQALGGSSGDGTIITNSRFPLTSSVNYADYIDPPTLKMTVPSSGNINCTVSVSINVTTNVKGNYNSYGKWQYRKVGTTTWNDLAAEQIGSAAIVTDEDLGV